MELTQVPSIDQAQVRGVDELIWEVMLQVKKGAKVCTKKKRLKSKNEGGKKTFVLYHLSY